MFITEKLIYALIIPKLNNANILLYGLTKFLIDRLKNVQNHCYDPRSYSYQEVRTHETCFKAATLTSSY